MAEGVDGGAISLGARVGGGAATAGEGTAEAGVVVSLSVVDFSVTLGNVSTGDCQFETMSHSDWLISQGSPNEIGAGDVGASALLAAGAIVAGWFGGATTNGGGETTVAAGAAEGAAADAARGSIAGDATGELVAAAGGGVTGRSTIGDGCSAGNGFAPLVVRLNLSAANPSTTRAVNGTAHNACFRQRGTVRGGIVQGSVVAANGRGESSSSKISANSAIRSIGV